MTVAEGGSGGLPGWPTPLAFLYGVAMEAGLTVYDYRGGEAPNDSDTAAIVADGNLIALNGALADDGLRADVLAMALEVATVMTDRPGGRRGAIYAPTGSSSSPPTGFGSRSPGQAGSPPSWPARPAGTPPPRRSSTTSRSSSAPCRRVSRRQH
jgi:hypothetical protein